VKHPLVKAGGFTGSRSGGTSLMKIAAARPEPIPFFAEMSSTNPVFILPGALRENAEKIATGLFGSFTLGAGQFCTKPGMVFLEKCEAAANFTAKLRDSVNSAATAHLLTAKIRSAYEAGIGARQTKPGVKVVAAANSHHDANGVGAALFETDAETFLRDSALSDEIFGPATLLIQHSNREELLRIARELEGHLTATLHGTEQDLCDFGDLIAILEQKAGRLIFNGFPTGVEVSHAMVHGGPFPATSDPRWTSVGTLAIYRFCRPVCYQGFPDASLPDELKDENPLEIWRIIDGEMSREPLQSRKLEAAS
jgi:NADP-dependent aldehyde dehydrogenase